MNNIFFFKNKGPFSIKKIIAITGSINSYKPDTKIKIHNISSLLNAKEKDVTFLHSAKYKNQALKTIIDVD